MDISFYTVQNNLNTTVGYGVAGFKMVTSLQELGHRVPFDDPTAPVQISLCSPPHYKFHEGQYKIGYTPWESTELPDGWLEAMNACDEVWATSQWTADVYKKAGVKVPVKVYLHGLDPMWKPVNRTPGDVVKFLHMGEPALRKGGQMTVDAFRAAFGDREDVHLTIKAYYQHYLRTWDNGKIVSPEEKYSNVTVTTELMHPSELVSLISSHDVLVYPSYGEGFGFIPLQALGTGMPVICTDEWAPYADFLGPLTIGGRWDRSIWSLHPGNVFYPDYDMLVSQMRHAAKNLATLNEYYSGQAAQVHEEFDWLLLTKNAFDHIVKRFSNSF